MKLALAESVVLAMAGGLAGALLAYLAVGVVGPLIPADLQRLGEAAVDGRALAFSALATGLVVALAGIGPALTVAMLLPTAIAILGTIANIIEDKKGRESFDPLKLRVGVALC